MHAGKWIAGRVGVGGGRGAGVALVDVDAVDFVLSAALDEATLKPHSRLKTAALTLP